MGSSQNSKSAPNSARVHVESPSDIFQKIADRFQTIDEVQEGLRECGLESSNLIIGIDYTGSNKNSGKNTFGGKCLHQLDSGIFNPYQEVIQIMGATLEAFDDDKLIPVYGFGDEKTHELSVFPFKDEDEPCKGFQEVLEIYEKITPKVKLSGPTSFAPIVNKAIEIVKKEQSYHILVIVADGQISSKCEKDTSNSIVEASKYPLSIITVGVGDGPWDIMEEYDDKLPKRKFDNFQFVPFHKTMERAENREVTFSVAALQEIPDQYAAIKKLGYLDS